MQYAEHHANKEGLPTLTKIVRADIDRMILQADSFEDFLACMHRLGYRIREGKYITYCPPGFTKGRRDKNLGPGYSRDEIRWRICHKEKETRQVSYQRFKVSSVFDVSQTFGDPIPSLEVPELTGDAEHFDVFMEAVRKISPVPIRFDQIPGGAKGYYDNTNKNIVIMKGMSQSQTMKTAVHELGHSLCHDRDFLQSIGEKKDRVTMNHL